MDVNYDRLVSEVLDAIGCVAMPSPADGWVELSDLFVKGKERGLSDAQIRRAMDWAVEEDEYERVKHGRRIFYREVRHGKADLHQSTEEEAC